MRLAALAASALLAGCGSATTHPVPTTVPTITLGTQTFALDQLAASPDDGSGTHLLYAVVRVTTTSTQYTAHEARFTLVDASGHRYGTDCPATEAPAASASPARPSRSRARGSRRATPPHRFFDVVRAARESSLRALTDDQVWAAIAAELAANGVDLGDHRLGFENAASASTRSPSGAGSSGFFPPGR
ncbi:MAG: hypothetical protein JF887_13470 [Candidatus Dormibacteraeota bacterium]|uniref:Lipoprotein n=1 Tax=Candidatus Amunia macphersoniae TaxID=3127014 RepID=A0A934KMK2_9BACT|nr:hypothetical protein [Candidatus Dormibacteraeota bacterium]